MSTVDVANAVRAGFGQYFEVVPALDEQTRDAAFRIRHEVYCEDLGWEPARPDGRETDEHDRHSVHCLLRTSSPEARYIGCIRLVLPRPDDPAHPLPFERTCAGALDDGEHHPGRMPRRAIAEVSRLAVVREFRRRKGERERPFGISDADFGTDHRARFPHIPVGLYLGPVAIAMRLGVEYLYVLTEARLAQHFGRLGFDIRRVGRPIEHRGTRVPSMMRSRVIVAEMKPMLRPLYSLIEEQVARAFAAAPEPPFAWLSGG